MDRWLAGLLVVVLGLVVVLAWLVGWRKPVGLSLVSNHPSLAVELVEIDKLDQAVKELSLRWWLTEVKWVVTSQPQKKAKAQGLQGQLLTSMDYRYNPLTGGITIKMHYNNEYLNQQGEDLPYVIARDMLVYAYMSKYGGWEKGRLVKGLNQALDWVEPRMLGGGGWVRINRP
jgi:hypothetical protein